jgi:hypothetical protein
MRDDHDHDCCCKSKKHKKIRKKKKRRSSQQHPCTNHICLSRLSVCLFCLCVLVLFFWSFKKKINFLTCSQTSVSRLFVSCVVLCLQQKCGTIAVLGPSEENFVVVVFFFFLCFCFFCCCFFPNTHLEFAEAVVVEGFLLLPLLPHNFLLFLSDGFLSDSSALRSLLQNL